MIKTRTGQVIESNAKQNKLLKKLYGNVFGRVLLKTLTAPAISKAAGCFMDSPPSKLLIKPFIRRSGIDTSQYIMTGFRSYNDFFTRVVKLGKRPIDRTPDHLISPCDSKLTAYKIGRDSIFRIKGSRYRVTDLLQNDFLAKRFSGGYCLIFSLEVDDYHRYCYIDDGYQGSNHLIPGVLHSVQPIACDTYPVFVLNQRNWCLLTTEHFGPVVQCEIGALVVGGIYNGKENARFCKGDEKGHFELAGSTIVLLFEAGQMQLRPELLTKLSQQEEVRVNQGEWIGVTERNCSNETQYS